MEEMTLRSAFEEAKQDPRSIPTVFVYLTIVLFVMILTGIYCLAGHV
jgi:hypothetical protein